MEHMIMRVGAAFGRSFEGSPETLWDVAYEIVASCDVKDEGRCNDLSTILLNKENLEWDRALSGSLLLYRSFSSEKFADAFDEVKCFIDNCSSLIDKTRPDVIDAMQQSLKLYFLHLVKHVPDTQLASNAIIGLLVSLKNCAHIGFQHTDLQDDEDSTKLKLTLGVLSTTFDRATALHSQIIQALSDHADEIITNLFDFMDNASAQWREKALKQLLVPLLAIFNVNDRDETSIAAILARIWGQVLRSDADTASVLLCAALNASPSPSVDSPLRILCNSRENSAKFWKLIQQFTLSSDMLVRKRAAFILQKLPKAPVDAKRSRGGKSSSLASSSHSGRQQQSQLQSQQQKQQKHQQDQPVVDGESIPLTGCGGYRYWWEDFLDVYEQVEGCSSMHLVQQVWGLLQHLCRTSTATETLDGDENSSFVVMVRGFGYPTIRFSWVKALLHSLLRAQIPNVRKAALRAILGRVVGVEGDASSSLVLPIGANMTTARWLCEELFPAIDSVGFFSAYFLGRDNEVGCGEDGPAFNDTAEPVMLQSKRINITFYPGVLMPSFLAWFLRKLAEKTSSDTSKVSPVASFIVSIVSAVCGDVTSTSTSTGKEGRLRSFSASKWILRVFAEEQVLRLVPRCLGTEHVSAVRTYIRTRLARSNGLVREHILQGLLPLLLRAVEPARVPLCDLFHVFVPVDRDDHSVVGRSNSSASAVAMSDVKRIFGDGLLLRLFGEVSKLYLNIAVAQGLGERTQTQPANLLLSCMPGQTNAVAAAESVTDEIYLPILHTIVHLNMNSAGDSANATNELLTAACKSRVDVAIRLYRSAYLSREEQRKTIWFLRGIAWTVLSLSSLDTYSGSGGVQMATLLPLLQAASDDIVSYLCFILQQGVCGAYAAETSSGHVVHSIELIDACTDIIAALLLLPKYGNDNSLPASAGTGSVSAISLGSVAKLLTTISTLLDNRASRTPTAGVGHIAAARCTEGLLAAIKLNLREQPNTAAADVTSAGVDVVVASLLGVLVSLKGIDASLFKAVVESYRQPLSGADGLLNGSGSLIEDILLRATNSQFGRASAMFSESRWVSINLSLSLLLSSGSSTSTGTIGQEFLASAIEEMETCPMQSLPDIFAACTMALGHLVASSSSSSSSLPTMNLTDLANNVLALLEASWNATVGSNCNDVNALNAFIRLAFDASVLTIITHDKIHEYYLELMDMGLKSRPHIIQSLVFQLCAVWTAHPLLCLPFSEEIKQLLLYRESKQDDHNTPDDLDIVVALNDQDSCGVSGICRFSVLIFLESLVDTCTDGGTQSANRSANGATGVVAHDPRVFQFLRELILSLVELNKTKDFATAAMIGSEAFGRKLRCWQALSVLSKFIDEQLLQEIVDDYFVILTHPCAHGIRVPIEVFGAAVGKRFPTVFLPKLLQQLKEFNLVQQTLCSLFVVLGHLFFDTSEPDFRPRLDVEDCSQPGATGNQLQYLNDRKTIRMVIDHLMPWLSCAAGLPRAVAQMLMHALIPRVIAVEESAPSTALGNTGDVERDEASSATDYLRSIYNYLNTNRDSVKVIPKQRQFFVDYNPGSCCSVAGLTAHTMDAAGEILPVHMLTLLVDALKDAANDSKECWSEGEKKDDSVSTAAKLVTKNGEDDENDDDGGATGTGNSALQRKIIPFDELQLTLSGEALSRSRNAAGRRRQEVVVCASLVDKVTNLAGIARTCEIFAVQQLVMGNLAVTKSESFLGIAVSCEGWLPMAEVPPHKLTLYLRTMRQRGYVVVGLEQTDASENLATVAELPSKCVLLLGKEKEGIPVELLQEVDIFLEIPQFGVIRSLNVHVSAALALWEITRRNAGFLKNNEPVLS